MQYGEAEYWDHRYQAEPVFFDWYLSYQGLGAVLQQHVPVDASILQVSVPSGPQQEQEAGSGVQAQSPPPPAAVSAVSGAGAAALSAAAAAHLLKVLPCAGRWLQVGVGTSLLQAQMVQQAGYQNILSVDISSVAIKHMQQVHSHMHQLQYRVGDAR